MNDPQNLPTPTLRFRPYVLQKTSVFQSRRPPHFQKRYYKYIHHLTLKLKIKSFMKKMPMPKILHTLNIIPQYPGPNLRFVKKLVKPYQKCLRDIQGAANHPEIQKLLPLLADLRVNPTQEALRRLAFQSGAKRLCFDILAEQLDGEEVLEKYKILLSRSLASLKSLTALLMIITRNDMRKINLMLEIICQSVPSDSLKEFSFHFWFDSNLPDFQELHEQQTSISKVYERLTHLYVSQFAWYSFFISCGSLTNLSVLWLQLYVKDIPWDSEDLLQFHHLPKLHKLTLEVTGHSEASDTNFLKNLTLPSTLEDLGLTLAGFALNEDHSTYSLFFERLQEAKRVKALNLRITENAGKSAAQFACLFIKCFNQLEVLHYTNLKGSHIGLKRRYPKAKCLEFQDLLTAVAPSKKTLQTISVTFPFISFPEDMHGLNSEFPRLQKLKIQSDMWLVTGLGKFCQKISSLRNVTLKELKVKNEERLKMLLDDMKEIPEGKCFELHLDVGRVKSVLLVDCLREYIEEVKAKGRLGVYLTRVQVEDKQALLGIFKLVREKGCFESFQIKMKGYQTLFHVVRRKILKVSKELRELN